MRRDLAAKNVVEYYKKNATNFEAAEAIHAGHIVKNVDQNMSEQAARDAMEQIRLTLQAGKPFEELADESSDCPGRGGDLGFFPRGRWSIPCAAHRCPSTLPFALAFLTPAATVRADLDVDEINELIGASLNLSRTLSREDETALLLQMDERFLEASND